MYGTSDVLDKVIDTENLCHFINYGVLDYRQGFPDFFRSSVATPLTFFMRFPEVPF
jgi:hypothetical protein